MNLINLVDIIKYKKNRTGFIAKAILGILFSISLFTNCMGSAKVETTTLVAEAVDEETVTTDGTPSIPTPPPLSSLFNNAPGTQMKMSSFGTVDPVGTTLPADFDGDGIINSKETIGNFWVADYPSIETTIAPPVTMKIQVLTSSNTIATEITSDFTSNDFESRVNEGTEKFHQKEIADRTERIKYSVDASFKVGTQMNFLGTGGGGSAEGRLAIEDVRFETQPFVNNIDRNATSTKSNSAETKARKYRRDKKNEITKGNKVEANAGTIRAALFIKNHTVNMPVKLSNILCSLLLESPTGELIPIQSFRLRNSDYSIFSVEVYGHSEFGPYVVELSGLNTSEIENAIAQGYTPKIYLIDYEMTHVADSNYRAALSSSFTGNNLKIIEENAKGRTALIKLIGPNMREMFRVAAFDLSTAPADNCNLSTIDPLSDISPGISFKTAMERISCSGLTITYEHYLFDYTGTGLITVQPKFYYYGIKSINGVSNNFPCHARISGTDANNNPVSNVCHVKVSEMSETELNQLGVWMIYDNGKHFDQVRSVPNVTFDGTTPIREGINSIVWAGDNYDVVYYSLPQVTQREQDFGTNPIETGAGVAFNTRWNKDSLAVVPHHPTSKSEYFGRVALGDQVEIEIQLNQTDFLNPSFGTPVAKGTYNVYNSFTYDSYTELLSPFTAENAFDIQVSFALGGTYEYWYSIGRTDSLNHIVDTNTASNVPKDCGQSWNYVTQTYLMCIEVPSSLPGASFDGTVDVYIRTTPNNAYREVIWPQDYRDVNKFQGEIAKNFTSGATFIEIKNGSGDLGLGINDQGATIHVGANSYTVDTAELDSTIYSIGLQTPTSVTYAAGDVVTTGTFNGKIKNPVNIGAIAIDVIPDTPADTLVSGTSQNGVTINILADTNTMNGVSVAANVHTIHLQSALAEDHQFNEKVFIKGTLTESKIVINQDTNFVTDWNADATHASSGLYIPDDANYLYTTSPTGCTYGLDSLFLLSPGCQGYLIEPLVANWVGSSSFANDWNDSTGFDTYLSKSLNPYLQNATGTSLNVESQPNRSIIVNNTHKNTAQSPASYVHGDKTIVVWSSFEGTDLDIRGRIIDTNTGYPLTGEFIVNEVTTGDQVGPSVYASGTNAIVLWKTGSKINARRIDLTLSTPVTASEPEFTVTQGNTSVFTRINHENDTIAVAFNINQNDTYGRMISISGAVAGNGYDARFAIRNAPAANDPRNYETDMRNGIFVVAWDELTSGNAREVYAKAYNTNTFGARWGHLRISPSHNGNQWHAIPVIFDTIVRIFYTDSNHASGSLRYMNANINNGASSGLSTLATGVPYYGIDYKRTGDYGFLSYRNGNTSVRYTTYFNASTGTKLGSKSFSNPSTNTPAFKSEGNLVLAYWDAGGFYHGQIYDFTTNTEIDQSEIPLSDHLSCAMSLNTNGPVHMIFCIDYDGISTYDVAGQRVFVNTSTALGLQYGMNNFFKAPLIERDYTIKARLRY